MKRKYLIIALVLLFPQIVLAAPSATISTSANSIEKGKSVTATVTLTDTAAWNIKINGSGAATCSQKQADVTSNGKSTTKKFTLSCTSTQEGTINFKVTGDITSGSGQTKDISLTKDVSVTKPKSSDNNLSDLKVDGATVSGFSSSKTSYTLKDNSGTSINISATANDSKASVSGNGTKSLKYGKNTFGVTVTAENGSKKTYNIIVNKPDPRSKNNNLKALAIDKGTIEFNKNTTSYLVKLEHEINEITITASVEDSKARISGTGTKTLKDYVNEFKIVVTAENGSTKTYVVKVARKDEAGNYGKLSTDNSVKSISVTGFDIKFNKDTKKYNVLIDEEVNEVEIKVTPNDSKATVTIENNTDLKVGLNKVVVKVTAENGDANEYLFNVYKIGEESKKEEVIPTPTPTSDDKKEESNQKTNIWMIISGIELLLIIILLVLLLLKKRNKGNNENNQIQKENQIKTNESSNNNSYVSNHSDYNSINSINNSSLSNSSNLGINYNNDTQSMSNGLNSTSEHVKKEIDIDNFE